MRRLARLVLPFALLLPLAACGDTASAQQIVASAPEATVAETTATVSFHMDMTGVPEAGDVSFDGEGAIDFEHQRTAMSMDMGDAFAQMGLDDVDGTMELRMDGSTMYMRSGLFGQIPGLDADGKWIKIDLAEVGEQQGLDLSQLQQPGTNDPSQQLALLEGVSKDGVKEVGKEKVDGVDTTHYRAEVDLEKAIRSSKGITDAEAFRQYVDKLGAKTVEVNVWIDGDRHVRRMVMPLDLGAAAGGAKMKMTMEFGEFGKPVDVDVPSASEVIDYQELLDATGQSGD